MSQPSMPRSFLTKASDLQLDVLNDVAMERSRQDVQWGGAQHDDEHPAAEFVGLIEDFAAKARRATSTGDHEARRRFVQIAALAVAAIESLDRFHGG